MPVRHGRLDRGLGQPGEVARGLDQVRRAQQVAPHDAHHLAPAQPAQLRGEPRLVGIGGQRERQPLAEFALLVAARQVAALEQPGQQLAVARERLRHELAAAEHPRQRRGQRGIGGEP
jgi:hypothetical protein